MKFAKLYSFLLVYCLFYLHWKLSMSEKKIYKPLLLNITVINAKTEEVIREFRKTIDGVEKRKWLSEFIIWATLNGNYVQLINQVDDAS